MQVKLFGERNTGTRYLARLLEQNLSVDMLAGAPPAWVRRLQRQLPGKEWLRNAYFVTSAHHNLGWKHSLPNPDQVRNRIGSRSVLVVTLTKNPYAWLVSLYRRPYHQHWDKRPSFSEFLGKPWQTIRREAAGKNAYASPVTLWNEKNAAYLALAEQVGAVNMTYENLLQNPSDAIADVAASAGAKWDPSTFVNLESSTKKSTKTHADYRAYYAQEQWRREFSEDDINLVNRQLSSEVVQAFGYELIR